MTDRRLNIGFLIDDLDNYFSAQACKGAELAAKALDANLFIFPGHYLGMTDSKYEGMEFEYQYNTVFELESIKSADILYVLMGTIGSRAPMELQYEFLSKLPKVPVVTLFSAYDGYPSVMFDNRSGFRKAILHLINKHGTKKLGFVSGPPTNRDAVERLETFRATMEEAGLEVPDSAVVYGNFTENSDAVVEELLNNNKDLEGIVFANDNMAVGGYRAIRKAGLTPGRDIKCVSYDDDFFAVSMDPPLSTVEASSAELTYRAVLNARNYINKTHLDATEVETHLVQRNSCGCEELDVDEMSSRLGIDLMAAGDKSFIESVKNYLFGIFADDAPMIKIKDALTGFFNAFTDFAHGEGDVTRSAVEESFSAILKTDILLYTTPERFFNVLQTMQARSEEIVMVDERKLIVNNMFSNFYRQMSFAGVSMTRSVSTRMERVSRLVNKQTGDIFLMSGEEETPYEHLISGLTTVGFRRSFLYLFQGNNKNCGDDNWKCPKTMLLKAVSDERGDRKLSENQQLIRTQSMFTNEHVIPDRRLTMTVFPLFVGEDLYGMLVNELDSNDFGSVSPVAYQLSVTMKSMIMIEEQNKVKKNLQESLEQFMRDNSMLDEMSKSDELTGLYNRRGFLDYTQKAISDPANKGEKALICYADMDNLKMVNDKFGHDDGDFSLREIASILKDTFRSTDIVGRLGGDEFVAFAITGVDHYEETIKARIDSITKKHNEKAGKPYPIEMSTGVYEFVCSPEIDIYEILDLADEKLYAEKNEKKARRGTYR